MPRKRADLIYDGVRLLRFITQAKEVSATPLYAKWRYRLNRRPSVIILWSSIYIRFQPKSLAARQRYIRRYGHWHNRVYITPCVLNSRWVAVKETDPDYEAISVMSQDEKYEYGIITTKAGLKRLTYEVVRDLSSGMRQPGHVTDVYDAERLEVQTRLAAAQNQLRQARSGVIPLPAEVRSKLIDEILTSASRLYDIEQIYDDRVLRAARLSDLVVFSTAQLTALAKSLSEFAHQVERPDGPRVAHILAELRYFEDQIGLYATPDVRILTRNARRLIRQVRKCIPEGSIDPTEAKVRLLTAAQLAEEASRVLSNWRIKQPLEVA